MSDPPTKVREPRVRAAVYGRFGLSRSRAATSVPAQAAGERARRLHGKGPEAAGRQSANASAIHPRRNRAIRSPRPGANATRGEREYAWYVRDGLHVRSPVRFDGVAVGDEERKKYEEEWAQRERERLESKDKKAKEADKKEEVPRNRSRPGLKARRPFQRRASCRKPTSWTSSSSRGTTISPAANNSTGSRCFASRYYPKHMFDDSEERQNEKERATRKGREEDRQGERLRATHRAPDEQDGARDAMGRSGRASDRQVHLRQRLDGLPARRLARQGRRYPRVDDDGAAVPGRVAAARDEHPRRHHDGHGLARGRVRAPLLRLQGSRRQVAHPDSDSHADPPANEPAAIRRCRREGLRPFRARRGSAAGSHR